MSIYGCTNGQTIITKNIDICETLLIETKRLQNTIVVGIGKLVLI